MTKTIGLRYSLHNGCDTAITYSTGVIAYLFYIHVKVIYDNKSDGGSLI